MLVKIEKIQVTDVESQYGPQKRIVASVNDGSKIMTVSGWIKLPAFNFADWEVGRQVDLDIYQSAGKDGRSYWNFKLPSAKTSAARPSVDCSKQLEVIINLLEQLVAANTKSPFDDLDVPDEIPFS